MSLSAGDRLGPYEIVAPLGEGGMGIVYRARDIRLGREVAVKLLPAALAQDPDRRHRFEHEARALAALNHPNILTVFDVGENYLVAELVEGASLRGAQLPLRKILDIAAQIAEGLAAAHAAGIAHRDLKPDNIMLTRDGRVKILDFGLARQADAPAGVDPRTITVGTDPGTVMGTVGYMSPEQVRGEVADARSDIFSLGVVLHELIAGERPFRGDTAVETMNAVLKTDAPSLPEGTPASVARLIDGCLAKEREERWQSARDIAKQLRWLAAGGSTTSALQPVVEAKRGNRERLVWAAALAISLIAAIALAAIHFREQPPEVQAVKFTISAPEKARLGGGGSVSPDGRTVVFLVSAEDGRSRLYLRPIDSLAATPVPGSEDAFTPFWSPDGRYIAFTADRKLKKTPLAGGPSQVIGDGGYGLGSWNREDVILYRKDLSGPLYRISASGGSPAAATTLAAGELTHLDPQFLPDGKHFLFGVGGASEAVAGTYLASLDGKVRKRLIPEVGGRYGSGYLLFRRESALMVQQFDATRLELIGEPSLLLEEVRGFGVSDSGALLYAAGSIRIQLAWFDRTGKVEEKVGEPAEWNSPVLSPDEKRVAIIRSDQGNRDVWILDLVRNVPSRFTFHPKSDDYPLWSVDGKSIVFGSNRDGPGGIYEKSSGGAGGETLLLKSKTLIYASSFSPDGKVLLYEEFGTTPDIMAVALEGERKPYPVVKTDFSEFRGRFSPDGKWLAYESDESGIFQVYVQPFPPTGAKFQVSANGGREADWRGDGKELFFFEGRKFMAVEVKTGTTFEALQPKVLFEPRFTGNSRRNYAPTHDGKRFLMSGRADDQQHLPLTVFLNWSASLKKK